MISINIRKNLILIILIIWRTDDMELTKKLTQIIKGVSILFMLLLHLFCTKKYNGLFTPIIMIGNTPLIYYLALFGDMCVVMCFCSGYGLMAGYKSNKENYSKKNLIRIIKLYVNFWIIILLLFVVILGPIMGVGGF